jgi:hypothetical protein
VNGIEADIVIWDETVAGPGDTVTHLWCCNPNKSWCGTDIEADIDTPTDDVQEPDDCVVCLDLRECDVCWD